MIGVRFRMMNEIYLRAVNSAELFIYTFIMCWFSSGKLSPTEIGKHIYMRAC